MACLPPELPYGSNNRRVEPILRLLRTALPQGEVASVSCFFLLFTGVT
jgi:hypothetical protein